MYTHM